LWTVTLAKCIYCEHSNSTGLYLLQSQENLPSPGKEATSPGVRFCQDDAFVAAFPWQGAAGGAMERCRHGLTQLPEVAAMKM